jgi:hypothetical protein
MNRPTDCLLIPQRVAFGLGHYGMSARAEKWRYLWVRFRRKMP